jgi:hypothetical protein
MYNTTQIATDIERGIQIKAEIATLTEELKAIEKRLEAAGQTSDQVPLQDPNREGKQYLARSAGRIVPVRFESDLLAASFPADSPMHKDAAAAAGEHLPKFFAQSSSYGRVPKDGEAVRKLARQLLAADRFAAFIRAVTARDKSGIAKSRIVVAWADAKSLDQA